MHLIAPWFQILVAKGPAHFKSRLRGDLRSRNAQARPPLRIVATEASISCGRSGFRSIRLTTSASAARPAEAAAIPKPI